MQRMHPQVDAGLDGELVLGDPKAPRFVYWNKELLPTPSGPDIATFKLLSVWGKIRAGLGAIGIKQPMPGKALLASPTVMQTHAGVDGVHSASIGQGGRAAAELIAWAQDPSIAHLNF
jgi:hypothetical protein